MSSPAREREKKLEREARWEAEEKERFRKAALNIYERIDEAKTIEDIKDILTLIIMENPTLIP